MKAQMKIVIYLKNKKKPLAEIIINDISYYEEFNEKLKSEENIISFGQISFDKSLFAYSKLIMK